MKKILWLALFACSFLFVQAQEARQTLSSPEKRGHVLPSVSVKTLDGTVFNTRDISNDGKPVVISFWATWCKPCIAELQAIADVYDEWVETTGVKLYAVSIDDAKTTSKVAPFVKGKAWEYEILLDPNGDFKRAMSVGDVPFLFVLNGKNEITWSHTSYSPGAEEEVFEKIKKTLEDNK
ncbi:MAG: TlpA family protein disulfide reductase [Bacteroidales bacterium]|nr:TlpA family protein disulfide reductase [Bacteroidales bacterium]